MPAAEVRYRTLRDWLKTNGVETAGLPVMYRELRDEALTRGLIRFFLLTEHDSEPFAIGTDFYGESLEAVVDEMTLNSPVP